MTKVTPYWADFLSSDGHRSALLAGLAASVLASFPWGWDGFLLTALLLAAVDVVAVAFVPGTASFQAWADRQERTKAARELTERLLADINLNGGSDYITGFRQMTARVESLYRLAEDSGSSLKRRDVEGLEDACIDYLRLCLSDAVLKGARRKQSTPIATLKDKLDEVQQTLAAGDLDAQQTKQLRNAQTEFTEAIARHGRMAVRRQSLEASLLAMPDRMEEVYQMVMTAPRADNLGSLLEESLLKLRITEQIEMGLDEEFLPGASRAPARSTLRRRPQAERN